jgi:hypothetical protein
VTDNVSKLTTNTERAIAAMQAKMRAAGMETAEGEPEEIDPAQDDPGARATRGGRQQDA